MKKLLNIYQPYLNEDHSWIGNYVDSPEEADIIVFSGGADVTPELYGENKGQFTHCNLERDRNEVELFRKWYGKKAFVGVCRGAQFLTVMAGGKLIQHVNNHGVYGTHEIETVDGDIFNITSTHHQMCYPYDLKDGYEVIAHAHGLSDVYLNGSNKETNLSELFKEPEIIFYSKINALAIQGHPEYSHCPDETVDYCLSLINQKLKILENA